SIHAVLKRFVESGEAESLVVEGKVGYRLKGVCPKCFGTGLEVIAGKGARRCDCGARGASKTAMELFTKPAKKDALKESAEKLAKEESEKSLTIGPFVGKGSAPSKE